VPENFLFLQLKCIVIVPLNGSEADVSELAIAEGLAQLGDEVHPFAGRGAGEAEIVLLAAIRISHLLSNSDLILYDDN
jgi:hypothetical protein